ncbi:SAM-dependent methyltransferase [Salinarimonas chemoclinalis]|uniref:SAM-dependent methyltransferase n=1 Tax=Salinarimonas chemoclinalis TaxID=3241599 RepID=UPI0035560578
MSPADATGGHAAAPEDFDATRRLYDEAMAGNTIIHDLVYPEVFGADEYVGQFSDNSASELAALGAAMALPAGARVLDVGCGRGAVAAFLAERLGWRVTGIDLAGVPLADAERRRRTLPPELADRLGFVAGNVYDHAFDAPFDGIYGTGAFCHFEADRLFARARALLRPGGRIAFMERVRIGAIAPDDWHRLTVEWRCPSVYTIAEYERALAAAGFADARVTDMTETFRTWQERSVTVREALAEAIVARTSEAYHRTALAHARYEADVTRAGGLGYALVVATRGPEPGDTP